MSSKNIRTRLLIGVLTISIVTIIIGVNSLVYAIIILTATIFPLLFLYLYFAQNQECLEQVRNSSPSVVGAAMSGGLSRKPPSVRVGFLRETPPLPNRQKEGEKPSGVKGSEDFSSTSLVERLELLGRRVRILSQQLEETSEIDIPADKRGGEDPSITAIRHLLEALEDRRERGLVAEHLYRRLRNKYIARLDRSRGSQEAAARRAFQRETGKGEDDTCLVPEPPCS